MKKLILGIMALGLFSCQITERMYLSESGMVEQQTEVDFSAMMSFMLTPEKIDSMKMDGQFPIDTIGSMLDASTMSTPEDEDLSDAESKFRQSFDKTKVRIVMDEGVGKVVFMTDKMSINDFNAYQTKIKNAFDEFYAADKDGAEAYMGTGYGSILQYKLTSKDFERKSFNRSITFDEEAVDSGFSAKEMIDMNSFKFEYHFPKAVKSSNLKDAEISPDGKTVTGEAVISNMIENPDQYNFKVEFK